MVTTNYPRSTDSYQDHGLEPPTRPWADISSKSGVHGDCGFDEHIIDYIWHKYKASLPRRQRATWKTQVYFYLGYVYIHHMPTKAQFPRVMATNIPGIGAICYSTFHNSIVPILECISAKMMDGGEIDWERRLLNNNHHHLFPYYVTSIVDCFPMEVQQPTSVEAHRLLNQGKYNATVLKGEVVITLTGEIVHFSFPHLGIRGDSRVSHQFFFLSLSSLCRFCFLDLE